MVGSVTNLGCVQRVEGVPEDRYIATIRKVGVDLGITQETALAWVSMRRWCGSGRAISLGGAQGSASAGVGLNVEAGLESLELRPGR